jgi:hypothetical protein
MLEEVRKFEGSQTPALFNSLHLLGLIRLKVVIISVANPKGENAKTSESRLHLRGHSHR